MTPRRLRLNCPWRMRCSSSTPLSGAAGMADAIPFGQPILVGHHSEKRDRRFRARIDGKFRKGIALHKKAEDLKHRAASVGTAGISSDDPEAIEKLREKVVK